MHQKPLRLAGLVAVTGLALVLPATPASAAPPANDDIAAAEVVSSLPHTSTSSTLEATRADDDPGCATSDAPTIWYAYTATQSMSIDAHTAGSDFDTTLGVFTGDRGALSLVDCNDQSQYGDAAAVTVPVTAGTTYYFMVSGFSGRVGNVTFTVTETPPPPPPPPSVTSVDVAFTAATVTRTGQVTLTGTVVCDAPAFVDLYVSGTQSSRRFTATGTGWVSPSTSCGTSPQGFQVTFWSGTGVNFVAGKLETTYRASAFGVWPDSIGYAEEVGSPVLRLQAVR